MQGLFRICLKSGKSEQRLNIIVLTGAITTPQSILKTLILGSKPICMLAIETVLSIVRKIHRLYRKMTCVSV